MPIGNHGDLLRLTSSSHTKQVQSRCKACKAATYRRLLLADDGNLAAPGRKGLQAVGQIADGLLSQDNDHILGPGANGVLGLIQGDMLYGTVGRHPVHLLLVVPLGGFCGRLLHRGKTAYG